MGHYVPHTDAEIAGMLGFMGLSSIDDLFSVVPEALRLIATGEGEHGRRFLDIADGLSEPDVAVALERLANANVACGPDLVCFAGAGAYDHEVPAAVRRVAFRSEFVTAYTPYQPEVAQGVLQVLFEYQTMIARLTGFGGCERLPLRRGDGHRRGRQSRGRCHRTIPRLVEPGRSPHVAGHGPHDGQGLRPRHL